MYKLNKPQKLPTAIAVTAKPTPIALIALALLLAACGQPQDKAKPTSQDPYAPFVGAYQASGDLLTIEPGGRLRSTWCAYDATFSPPDSLGRTSFKVAYSNSANQCYPTGRVMSCVISATATSLQVQCETLTWDYERIS